MFLYFIKCMCILFCGKNWEGVQLIESIVKEYGEKDCDIRSLSMSSSPR